MSLQYIEYIIDGRLIASHGLADGSQIAKFLFFDGVVHEVGDLMEDGARLIATCKPLPGAPTHSKSPAAPTTKRCDRCLQPVPGQNCTNCWTPEPTEPSTIPFPTY